MKRSQATGLALLAGLLAGLALYHAALTFGGYEPVSRDDLALERSRLDQLRLENRELADELSRNEAGNAQPFARHEQPYDSRVDAALMVRTARADAKAEGKFLMVTFGANWCLDCLTLHRHLNTEPVAGFARDLFRFVFVDVGKFNQNRDLAEALNVSLERGIPVAIFFDPDGAVIGTTNDGQLEPARHYSSHQILKFIRDVAERERILAPDSVE